MRAAGRDPATLVALGDGRRCSIGRDADEVRRREADLLAHSAATGEAVRLVRAAARALDPRHAGRGACDRSRGSPRPASQRIMLQDFLPRDLDMIDLAAEVLFD